MNTTELIVEHLHALGFSPEDIDGEGTDFKFEYRGKAYLLMDAGDDENFVRFAIPQVFNVTEENKAILLDQIQLLGFNIKYIKASICNNSVWIFYEHYQEDGTAITENTVEHIIRTMAAGLKWFYAELENYDEEVES